MQERSSVAGFLGEFHRHAGEFAYVQNKGYRLERWSYGRVVSAAVGFANRLESLGIGRGDRILLWGENCAEWVAAFFGCALRGVVVVPLDDGSAVDFARRVFEQVHAQLLVTSARHIQECAQAGFSVNGCDLGDVGRAGSVGGTLPAPATGRDDILEIVFTSGTTADPKGVVITHGNVLANIAPLEHEMQGYLKYERIVHPVRFLNLLPLSHVFGQFLGMFLPPLLAATVIFQEELKPSAVINTIGRERVSVLVSVPRVLQSLKQKIERDLEDRGQTTVFHARFAAAKDQHFLHRWWSFRKIRRQFGWKFWAFISGGAALDGETEEFWRRLGYAVVQGYGLTETTSLVSVNHPFKLGKGSIGKVLPGREVKLSPDGEILVRGAGIAQGYWDGAGAHTLSDDQGWYRTGDIGALDGAGNLYFKGRKKDTIVTPNGTNVYPEDLEAALRQQPQVKDCVVVGIDRDGNAEPCAVVILGDNGDAESAVKHANESLAEYQRMRMWMEWPEEDFPRTSTQKPRRNLITAAVRNRMQQPDAKLAAHAPTGPLSDLISRISGRSTPALRPDSRLDSDLGLSSLDRVELMSALEDRYQVDLSETRFTTVRTVDDLEKMLRGESIPSPGYHYPTWTLHWPTTWLRLFAHYLLMRPAVFLLGWPRVEGLEHLRGVNGPLLIVSNHIADVDVGFILTALPFRLRNRVAAGAGGEALEALRTPASERGFFGRSYDRFEWFLGVSLLNLFPLPREAGFRRSFAYAGEAVDRGYSVLVFPEGRHTTTGVTNPFRAGIGLLAQNLGLPVLPMRIDGLFEIKQAGKRFAAPGKIRVRIGRPVSFERSTAPEKIARDLQKAVEEL